jgi:hypothetical protein
MKRNLITRFAVVLAVAASFAACSKTSPLAPSEIQLPRPSGEFQLRGSVSDSHGQLDNVAVNVSNGAYELDTLSDFNGEFIAGGLTAGEWIVTLRRSGYGISVMRVMVAGDSEITCSLEPSEALPAHKAVPR